MKRTVILGIGNKLKGDDYIGPQIVEILKLDDKFKDPDILIINCEEVPENHIMKVISFKPENVMVIDAADLNKTPGEYSILGAGDIEDLTTSTHTFSLSVLVDMMSSEIETDFIFFCIQPESTVFDSKISDRLNEKIPILIEEIKKIIL